LAILLATPLKCEAEIRAACRFLATDSSVIMVIVDASGAVNSININTPRVKGRKYTPLVYEVTMDLDIGEVN
jgi:hypothetical protein